MQVIDEGPSEKWLAPEAVMLACVGHDGLPVLIARGGTSPQSIFSLRHNGLDAIQLRRKASLLAGLTDAGAQFLIQK